MPICVRKVVAWTTSGIDEEDESDRRRGCEGCTCGILSDYNRRKGRVPRSRTSSQAAARKRDLGKCDRSSALAVSAKTPRVLRAAVYRIRSHT